MTPIFQRKKQTQPTGTIHGTPEAKSRASDATLLLRSADQLVKAGQLDEASKVLRQAAEIAPRNMYVLALAEHVKDLLKTTSHVPADPSGRNAPAPGETTEVASVPATPSPPDESPVPQPRSVMKPHVEAAGTSPGDTATAPPPAIRGLSTSAPRPVSRDTTLARRPIILAIDDDESMLSIICVTLRDFGFDPLPFETTDEAFGWLRDHTPDAILCDVNLETSTYGGFSFFEQTRHLPHLDGVPFLFLSGLTDDAILRTGKELGADDYLCKPYDEQMLVSSLKGKIGRYRRLSLTSRHVH